MIGVRFLGASLPLSLYDVPHDLSRMRQHKWGSKNKRMKGRIIEERPAISKHT